MIGMYYCWSLLFLWNFCVTSVQKLQVKEVDICPTDQSSWEKASRDLKCTTADRYQCTPNENQTALLEFCYHQPPTFVEKGYCWILSNSHFTDTYRCSGFTKGCPNTTYRSNELYKYQECLQVNKLKGCYLADTKCHSQRNVITTPSTTNRSTADSIPVKIIIGVMTITIFIAILFLIAVTFVVRRIKGQEGGSEAEGGSEEMELLLSKCPSITLGKIKPEGQGVTIEYSVSVSEECKSLTTLSWRRNNCDLKLSDESGKYIGGTLDDSCLRICSFNENSWGRYECTVRNIFGEHTIVCTLECPSINLKKIETEEKDVIIEYEVSVSEECKSLTTLSWRRNSCDLNLSDQSQKYVGGTLDDSCLRICRFNEECLGSYDCTVQNIFGEVSISCKLECPRITLKDIKPKGQDKIENAVSVSEECKSLSILSWKRNSCKLKLPDEREQYAGGALDDSHLRIYCFNQNSLGTYECTIQNIFECPSITLREIKPEGQDVIIEYAVSVSEECKSLTTLSWKRNECDLNLSDEPEKYAGGTLDDPFLRICCLTKDSLERYECTVRNFFGEDTVYFTLEYDDRTYGNHYEQNCSGYGAGGVACNKADEIDLGGCADGSINQQCNEKKNDFLEENSCGRNCSFPDEHCAKNATCDHANGASPCEPRGKDTREQKSDQDKGAGGLPCNKGDEISRGGCADGWINKQCNEKCTDGKECKELSGYCRGNKPCHCVNGSCSGLCEPGYHGGKCENNVFSQKFQRKILKLIREFTNNVFSQNLEIQREIFKLLRELISCNIQKVEQKETGASP